MIVYFNSIKVRLELYQEYLCQNFQYFNSIKVRLEPHKKKVLKGAPKFQFHKGTIRTRRWLHFQVSVLLFQFHKGTIRTRQARKSLPNSAISIP